MTIHRVHVLIIKILSFTVKTLSRHFHKYFNFNLPFQNVLIIITTEVKVIK